MSAAADPDASFPFDPFLGLGEEAPVRWAPPGTAKIVLVDARPDSELLQLEYLHAAEVVVVVGQKTSLRLPGLIEVSRFQVSLDNLGGPLIESAVVRLHARPGVVTEVPSPAQFGFLSSGFVPWNLPSYEKDTFGAFEVRRDDESVLQDLYGAMTGDASPLVQSGFPFSIPCDYRAWGDGLLGASSFRPGGFFRLPPKGVLAILGYPDSSLDDSKVADLLATRSIFPVQAALGLLSWVTTIAGPTGLVRSS